MERITHEINERVNKLKKIFAKTWKPFIKKLQSSSNNYRKVNGIPPIRYKQIEKARKMTM